MKFTVTTKSIEEARADALIVLQTEDGMAGKTKNKKIAAHIAAFGRAVTARKTAAEWFCTLEPEANAATAHLLLDSVSFGTWLPPREKLKTTACRAGEICRKYSLKRLAIACHVKDAAAFASDVAEGLALGDFRDTRFKSEPNGRPELRVQFLVRQRDATSVRAALKETQPICEAVNEARELVHAPNNVLTPDALAKRARAIAKKSGLECDVLSERALERQGYNLILAVGAGSVHPPRLIILRHKPSKKPAVRDHIVLLGKGICFDTGGYCLKQSHNMHTMNNDMGGAAAVIGAMQAIAALDLPVRVTGIVPAAVNDVDAKAYHPGSILTAKNGKTIYIENTDAEGRLVLADGLARAGEEKADIVIDFATLTGSAAAALGPQIAALFTDDEPLAGALLTSGTETGDYLWRLPLVRDYEALLAHTLADMSNIASGGGGAIHAANFLKAFVPEGIRWAHLDIAGPATYKNNTRYFTPGATGYGVRLVTRALLGWTRKRT